MDGRAIKNAFTVDVEDYFQVSAFEGNITRKDWDAYPSRVVRNTRKVLNLMERHCVTGTFFVLGWVAKRYPWLVREIHEAGHEIGSHSYWHRLIYELTPDEFRLDLMGSKQVLEDITGEPVRAYRAPSFSITRESLWALDILADEGIRCDSSIFPVHHDRYGIPDAPHGIHRVPTVTGEMYEFPASVLRVGPANLPVSGGGYFRLYPQSMSTWCLDQVNKTGAPFMFYIHPWELDPEQPRLAAGSRVSRWRHHVGIEKTEGKLEALLSRFQFGRMDEVLAESMGHTSDQTNELVTAQSEPVYLRGAA